MGLIDSIRQVFADDEDQITASDILSKVREKYPHLAGIDDAKLSASLAKKYPDRFGYLKTYAPGAPVPPAFVPKSMRTDAFYKANPEEGTKEALRVIDVVKAKYPKYKDIDAQTMAAALESKYPDTFKGLSSRLTPWKSSGAGDPEPSMPAPFAVLPNMPTQSQVKLGEVPKVGQVVSSTDKNTQPIQKPNVRPMVISLDSSKISLPKGTPVQTFKNGNDAYLAAEKAGRPIIVEYPNRSGKTIRRILGTTTVETTPPNVEDSLVDAITKKASDIAGTLGKATPEIVGEAVVETLRNPPDILNLTPEQQIRTGKNMATAGISTVAGMAGAVPAMARFLGADGKPLDGFDKAVGKLNEIARRIAPKDPTFGDKLTQGAVSMAAFFLPGMAAEGAIAQLPKLGVYAARIAKAAKIATPTVLEAATEQGGVYNDLVQKGMDKDEAAKRAFGAFWKNIILIGITNTAGFGPDVKSRLGKSLMAMPSEGFQEGGQNVIAKISKGEPVDWEEAAADAGIGAFLGFGGGSALGGSHGTAEADTVPRGPSGPDGAAPAVPETMSPEMRTYLDKVAEINRKAKEIPSSDFIKEEVFKVPTQKEANAAEEARFSVAPDTVQRLAHSIRNEAVGQYNLDRNAFNQWKDLIGPGLQPPKIISGQRDVMGEYNTLEVWMKKKDGRPLDVVAQDAVEMGLIKSPEDIFDALRSLKAPQNPSRNAVDYLDEALRIHDYESSIEPNGPVDTGFDFQVEQPDFSAEKPTLNKEHYTANLAKARIAGMPLREAVAFARESSLSKGQKDAVEAFNRIITANKLTDETFVQFVDSIKVDNEAFKKGYGAEFQSDKYAIRGATFPIKNHAAVKALVQFANGAHAGTGYHEAFHVVSSNVLTEQEYAVLQKKFGTEENIAESFAKYEKGRTGKEKQTAIKAIFDKIAAFLERLRSYFSGHGWRTADDVFRGVSEGRTEKSKREAEGPKFQAEPTDQTQTAAFKKWFGDSVVTDNGKPMSEGGRPLVVYHGTTHTFDEFKTDRANVENHYGKAFYFTDSKLDVTQNYSGEGPDLAQRIELRAERIFQGMFEQKKEPKYGGVAYEKAMKKARDAARNELSGGGQTVLQTYLKMENPVILNGQNSTRFEIEFNEEDGDESGNAIELYNAVVNTAGRFGVDGQEIWDAVSQNIELSDFSAREFENAMRENEKVIYIEDQETGYLASNEFIKEVYREAGFDGIIMDADQTFGSGRKQGQQMAMDEGTKHYVVFSPTQIKSATGNSGAFDPENPSILYQAESKKPVFYSQLERTIQEKMPNSAPVAMVKNLIDPAKGNVKAEEVEWSGIEEFLAGKEKVTKAELLDFLKANQVEVKEVVKGGKDFGWKEVEAGKAWEARINNRVLRVEKQYESDGGPIYRERIDGQAVDSRQDLERAKQDLESEFSGESQATKFANYQLPGGENYREVLLTLPDASEVGTDPNAFIASAEGGKFVAISFGKKHFFDTKEKAVEYLKNQRAPLNFKSSHFDEPNIIAHVRMNDRVTADGKKTLFLEEVQSDWHQKGREVGYRNKAIEKLPDGYSVKATFLDKKAKDLGDNWPHRQVSVDDKRAEYWQVYDDQGKAISNGNSTKSKDEAVRRAIRELNSTGSPLNNTRTPVPNAPFKKSWHELALKRMLRYAVENGYDSISWTTGEQQAERYDLGKQVDSIAWWKGPDGFYGFVAEKGGERVIKDNALDEKRLADYLGKEMAKRITEGTGKSEWAKKTYGGTEAGYLKGVDLKVGGEGMRGFYDQIIPAFLNKYTKKWGGRIGETEIETRMGQIMPKVHVLEITPAMRESVAQGQPMFQAEKTSLIEDSVYEKNRKMQRSGNLMREIGAALTSAKDQAETLFTPISSVLADIHPMFRIAFRRQAYREGLTRHEDTKAVLPFLEKAKSMRSEDRADLDLALKNGDAPKISALVSAYGLEAEYKAVRKTLNAIHARAKEVGYDVGYLEDYWPRVIKDQAGFLEAMKADKKWPDIEKLISMKQDELKRPLSEDEKVALINSYLRGYQNATIALARTPNMKTREVEVIGPGHFRRFDDAVVRYISSMNHAIEARRFFGRGGKDLFVDELDQSIGHYVLDMKSKGLLKNARDEKRLRDILNAYFDQKSMHGALAAYKDATVTMTIGNAVAALTQLQDLGTSVYRAPGHAVQSLGRAMIGGSKITLEDLGLEQIAEELRDDRKSAVFVSKVLRAAGLAKLDKLTAETFINSVISKYQSQAKAKNPGSEFMDRIRNLVGPDTGKAIEDLKSGEVTDLVKFIAFSEILGVQPKAMTELPKAYLSGGNARIFYALKTFQLRQLDLFRQEIFKKLAEPGLKNKVIGTRRLVALMTSLLLAGIGTDELKDWLLGRKTTMSDRVAENRLKLAGLSKWTIYKARQEGIGSAVMKTVLPPAPLVDQLWKDIRTAGDNKGLEVVQSIPLVGKFYYWWLGRGTLKRPISDDAMYLKQNAGRLGLSRTGAYRAMNRAIDIYQTMPKGPKREAAKARAMEIASKLADRVRAKESQFAEIEARRKKRAAERGLSR